jgi:peroxiredoxin
MRLKNFVWMILIVAFLYFLFAWGLFGWIGGEPKKINLADDGLTLPPFTLLNIDGKPVKSESFRGKVILLDFWATWCPPCREEIPALNELHRKYKKDGLVVIGISLDHGAEGVQKFVALTGVDYINLMGEDAVIERFNRIPGLSPIHKIPIKLLIDRRGRIHRQFVGFTARKPLEEEISAVLKKTDT